MCLSVDFLQEYSYALFLCIYLLKLIYLLVLIFNLTVFRFDASDTGWVFAKVRPDDPEVRFQLLKPSVDITAVPHCGAQPLPAPGLSQERRLYLYNNIRQFAKAECQDIMFPCPSDPVPNQRTESPPPPPPATAPRTLQALSTSRLLIAGGSPGCPSTPESQAASLPSQSPGDEMTEVTMAPVRGTRVPRATKPAAETVQPPQIPTRSGRARRAPRKFDL